MSNLDKTLKYLGIAWSLVAFVAAIAFFFGGQWQEWQKIRAKCSDGKACGIDLSEYVKKSDLPPNLETFVSSTKLLSEVEAGGFVKFGVPLTIRSVVDDSIGLMRVGAYVNAHPENGRTDGTWRWAFRKD